MKTSFACPTCRAPLLVKCVSVPPVKAAASACPNPFCRSELPARRDQTALVYALVGSVDALEFDEFNDVRG